jgi:uncharacterized protein (TIGR00730 family)
MKTGLINLYLMFLETGLLNGENIMLRGKVDTVTVFCGSKPGNDRLFREQAQLLGKKLAERGICIVYGGARVGLMGAVADGALDSGGKVIGVFPGFLENLEIAHRGLSELIIVDSMHARKTRMNELSKGVIALPGGFGTIEELFEMLTWAQLGLHRKPVALLNTGGYYDGLIELISKMVNSGFLSRESSQMLLVGNDIDILIDRMEDYNAPEMEIWISEDEV